MTALSRLAFLGRPYADADLRHDANIFTALRWILASSVMFSHGWDLTQATTGLDPSVNILSFPVSRLAVMLFFTLSGFLVTGGLMRRGVKSFAIARGLRLLPGLWAMLLVLTLGLGLTFGTFPFHDYLVNPETRRFIWRNALLLGGDYSLPGVFETHRIAGVVNGSLWTIPQEVRCYIALALLGAIGLLVPRRLLSLAFAALVVIHILVPIDAVPVLTNPRRLALSFFLGVLFYLWRERLWLSWPLALAATIGALLLPIGAVKVVAVQIAFGYLILVAAFCVPATAKAACRHLPDYSYGIYIYAFPAQQVVIALCIGLTPMANIGMGFALMLPAAALSWHLIEKPAQGWRSRLDPVQAIGSKPAR